ncbi:MAG TPA: HigA family addiction module antitoxin [Terriglobales bacterium]|nr:HigA family addiction module antitoxin [Terriglobales bacterium]
MASGKHWNIHPGEMLREEFLKPIGMSAYQLAKELRVPVPRVNDIVREKRGITADTAVRLARFFGTTAQYWMNLQTFYEVRVTETSLRKELQRITPKKRTKAD